MGSAGQSGAGGGLYCTYTVCRITDCLSIQSNMLRLLTVLVSLVVVTVRSCSISCPDTAPPCVDEQLGRVDNLCRGFLGCVTLEECKELNNKLEVTEKLSTTQTPLSTTRNPLPTTKIAPSTTLKPSSTTQRPLSTTQKPKKFLKPLKKAVSAPYRLAPRRKLFPSKWSWPGYSGQYGQYGQYGGPPRRRWLG